MCRSVVEWDCVGTGFPHLFGLDHIQTWLRSHRRASDTQIRTASQKSMVKQEDPVWKFLQANAHFIRTVWCSLPFHLVWERHSHFFSTTPWECHVHSYKKTTSRSDYKYAKQTRNRMQKLFAFFQQRKGIENFFCNRITVNLLSMQLRHEKHIFVLHVHGLQISDIFQMKVTDRNKY